MHARSERAKALRAELLGLGFPWPKYLEDKSIAWLETEIDTMKQRDVRAPRPS
jgi:predicted DNA-binding transcriptional regulator AlpA